ncbi:hypothetical protein L6164_006250 [Bauhinia variegata]|uniref:Uncharacterized protein n=1 Tax=Bauhinia variegata TaxID=167791 RepID=A0ACB9PTQ3_BAUVA|nr:hypothetical protein L6164_006250 [Bauhinia variegata]
MSLRPSSLGKANIKRSIYLWNLMIRDSTNNGLFTDTLKIYSSMAHSGVHGNSFTLPLVLKACANLASIQHGTHLHAHIFRIGLQNDVFVQTALIDMYSKCSHIASPRQLFDEMPDRSLVSWNAMISAYCRGSRIADALVLLKEMWVFGFEPSYSTFVSILSGFSGMNSNAFLRQGLSIHCCLIKLGLEYIEVTLANSIMSMYICFSQIDGARKVFDLMHEKSIISWTTIIGGYVKVGLLVEAFDIFNQMQHQSVGIDSVVLLNLISGCIQLGDILLASSIHSLILKAGCNEEESIENLLITMYTKCGDLISARWIFDLVKEKSILSWTSMIGGYVRSGQPVEALDLFRRLQRTDIKPNAATLATVLSACADLGSLSMGQEIEEYIWLNGLELDQRVQTSLIHMYSKCGSINKAREVFERVVDKDLTVWSSMINSYAIHGMGTEAVNLFYKMQTEEGIMPDAVIFTSILLACSHSGLVEHGLKYFKSMQKDYGIEPTVEHYSCLVDLLGRVGQLDLALDIIQGMPFELQTQAWAPFLSACRIHCNFELGKLATKKLLDLSPQTSGSYVLMANLYTSLGKWKEADMMRKLINDKGMLKECGWSQVDICGSFHLFVAGDQAHFQSVNVYKALEKLNVTLLEASYTAEAVPLDDL